MNILRTIILIITILITTVLGTAQIDTITYEITAGNLSTEAIDSYPQKLITYQKKDSLSRVTVSTFAAYADSTNKNIVSKDRFNRNKTYPESVQIFLKPTSLTNFNHPEIIRVADSILNLKELSTIAVIKHALDYSSKRIMYDNELAMELDKGNIKTIPVTEILERGKGTCSEYTNLFIALIRKIGIPCRMAVGLIYIPEQNIQNSHAWAECYIEKYGWLGVDPQNNFVWYPPVAIKLFHGRDFIDCNIDVLPDMYPIRIKILKQN